MPPIPETTPACAQGALAPTLTVAPGAQARHQTSPLPESGGVLHVGAHGGNVDELRVLLNERHEAWLREQYLRDLATLDRIEAQNACFFDAMGGIAAGRGHIE